MIHTIARRNVAEARRFKLLAEAIYTASAPFHLTKGEGLAAYNDFHQRMDNVINPPADPDAVLEAAAIASYEQHARRAGL